jgi:predicted membrane-bound spermidine synthase
LELFCIAAPVVGLCGIAYLPWMTYIFDMKILWNYQLMTWLLGIFGYLPHLYLSMLFFFMPSFFMGVCFPLLVQLERNLSNGTGDAVSLAYGVNTLGCVLGSVGTGFLLIPFLGSQTSMHILGLAATISGLNDSVPWYMALNVS